MFVSNLTLFDCQSVPSHAQSSLVHPEVLIAQYRQDVDEIHAPGMGHGSIVLLWVILFVWHCLALGSQIHIPQ